MVGAPNSDFPSDTLKWMRIKATPKMSINLMKVHCYFGDIIPQFFVVQEMRTPPLSNNHNMIQAFDEAIGNTSHKYYGVSEAIVITSTFGLQIFVPKIAISLAAKIELRGLEIIDSELKFITADANVDELLLINVDVIGIVKKVVQYNDADDQVAVKYAGQVSLFEILKMIPTIRNFLYRRPKTGNADIIGPDDIPAIHLPHLDGFCLWLNNVDEGMKLKQLITINHHAEFVVFVDKDYNGGVKALNEFAKSINSDNYFGM